MYDNKLAQLKAKIAKLREIYHMPDMELVMSVRIENEDPYRVAKIRDVAGAIQELYGLWEVGSGRLLDQQGRPVVPPFELAPGEVFLGEYRLPVDAGERASKSKAEAVFGRANNELAAIIQAKVDDTYRSTSNAKLRIAVAKSALEDTLRDHWRQSDFNQDKRAVA